MENENLVEQLPTGRIIVGVRDKKAGIYVGLQVEDDFGLAYRHFESAIREAYAHKRGMYYTHTEDFRLDFLGYWDDKSGAVTLGEGFTLGDTILEAGEVNVSWTA